MKNDIDLESELAGAIAANKNDRLLEWATTYLQGHQRNNVVVENIQKRAIVKIKLVEYPLGLLERPMGPLNGEAEPEPLHEWVRRVMVIKEGIENKRMPPPIIVTDFWEKLYIVDGNHRHEALLQSGFKKYWTIFFLEKNNSEKKIFKKLELSHTKIKAIIVDVGGVLVRELNKSARKAWGAKLHLTQRELTKEVYRTGKASLATIGKIKSEDIWTDVKNKFNLTEKEIYQLERDFFAGNKLNTEFYAFVQDVRKHYKTAILSNGWLNFREVYTKKFHLDKIVDQMIISAEEGMRKPNKKIFELALNRLGVSAEEVLYVDDRADNIRTASKLGMNTVLFTHTKEAIEKIKSFL